MRICRILLSFVPKLMILAASSAAVNAQSSLCAPDGNGHVIIPDTVTTMGSAYTSVSVIHTHGPLANCNMRTITIPNSVTFIGWMTFFNCSNLRYVVIPDSCTTIEQRAFESCRMLSWVYLPHTVTHAGGYDPFAVPPNHWNAAFPNCLYNGLWVQGASATANAAARGNLTCYGCATTSPPGHLTLPDTIEAITFDAFYTFRCLHSVDLPTSLTTLGARAFAGTSLTSVTLPDGVVSIQYEAFLKTPLRSLRRPQHITFGNEAFGMTTCQPDQFATGIFNNNPVVCNCSLSCPTLSPTFTPTPSPTAVPTFMPTDQPTVAPTAQTAVPTVTPTSVPTSQPTVTPTLAPTAQPTITPTSMPTLEPTAQPTAKPTLAPTLELTAQPTITPTSAPTFEPTVFPTATRRTPTDIPTRAPVSSSTSGTSTGRRVLDGAVGAATVLTLLAVVGAVFLCRKKSRKRQYLSVPLQNPLYEHAVEHIALPPEADAVGNDEESADDTLLVLDSDVAS